MSIFTKEGAIQYIKTHAKPEYTRKYLLETLHGVNSIKKDVNTLILKDEKSIFSIVGKSPRIPNDLSGEASCKILMVKLVDQFCKEYKF